MGSRIELHSETLSHKNTEQKVSSGVKHGFHIGIKIVYMDYTYGARLRAEPGAKRKE